MKHLILVLRGAASAVEAAPPASWLGIGARGRHGRALLASDRRWSAGEGREVLALLGYRPESPGGSLVDCDPLGRGEDLELPLDLVPFPRRQQLSGAWVSDDERSRGIARALGLAIFSPHEQARSLVDQGEQILGDRDLVILETLPPEAGWPGRPLAAFDLDVLVPLGRLLVERRGLRVLAIATATPGSYSRYVTAGAGVTPEAGAQPLIDRGEELLPRLVQSFNV